MGYHQYAIHQGKSESSRKSKSYEGAIKKCHGCKKQREVYGLTHPGSKPLCRECTRWKLLALNPEFLTGG